MTFPLLARILGVSVVLIGAPVRAHAWTYVGHRIVNELAVKSLPEDFPAFTKTPENLDRILYLADSPERWSHSSDLTIKHYNAPDHYIDFEQIGWAGLEVNSLPSFRYNFIAAFVGGRVAHIEKFPVANGENNADHTEEWPGFLPWTIAEDYGKLQTAFAVLKAYQQVNAPRAEIAQVEADIIYVMGIMGHYAGDASQPLHTTDQFNGWKGPNPKGYTADSTFHTWIDSGFIGKAGITAAIVAPRVPKAAPLAVKPASNGRDPVFVAALDFIIAQNKLVEALYQLEKDGKLARGTQAVVPEGRDFIEGQLAKGAEFLASIYLSAWRTSVPDSYMVGVLTRRYASQTPAPAR